MSSPFKREFEYFLILCRSQNISMAAEEAGIQQAGLSKALKTLEGQFKKPLFYRSNRGLTITPYGEIVRKLAVETLKMWDQSLEAENSKFSEVVGTYKIGAHPVIVVDMMAAFYSKLNEEHEGLNLELVLKKSSEITKDVIDFKLDFGVVSNPIRHPDLVILPLRKEFSACWGLEKKSHKKVLYYNSEMIDVVKNLKKYEGYKKIEINDYEVIAAIAKKSEGICLLPSPVAARHKGLMQIGKNLTAVEICLVYRHDALKTRAFVEVIHRVKASSN